MLSKRAQLLIPYTAGEQPKGGYVKLNTNENAYPPSPAVDKVLSMIDTSKLRLYPNPNCSKLIQAIANLEGVAPQNIFVGNGSDEVLGFAFMALFDDSVAYPAVGYSFYPVYADLWGLKKIPLAMQENLSFCLSDKNIKASGGLVLANPNAPTSLSITDSDLKAFIGSYNKNIIVDEAYIDFATKTKSLASFIQEAKNLLVVKTFSKSYSLAGLRVGYAIGSSELITGLNIIKNSFNSYTIDYIAQNAAIAAVKDRKYFDNNIAKIIKTRSTVSKKLKDLGHSVLDSDANFLFIKHKSVSGYEVYSRLKQQKILVRHFGSNAQTTPYVRVTIGTDADMDKFLEAFDTLDVKISS